MFKFRFRRNFLKFIFCGVILLLLSGCSSLCHPQYRFKNPPPWPERRCADRCLRNRDLCLFDCSSSELVCQRDQERLAYPQFEAYARRQEKLDLPAIQRVNNFTDYSPCSDRCGCQYTYARCFLSCGGKIVQAPGYVYWCRN